MSARKCRLLGWAAVAWVLCAISQSAHAQVGIPGRTCSSPIALTSDDRFVWVVNPANNSVSLLEVGGDVNLKRAELKIGAEPHSVAITPDGAKVYVTNTVAGTVSIINTALMRVVKIVLVGTEPTGCALASDGSKLYVANFGSDDVSVINTATDVVVKTIALPSSAPKPRAVAVTPGGKVYITSFLAKLRDDGRTVDQKEGRDDGKEGRVVVISSATDTVTGTIVLNPIADTGFLSNGTVLDRIPATDPPTFTFTTGAFPNLLQGIGLRGDRAYLPNTGASPNGPVRFNVNVQSFLSVFDTSTDTDSGQTLLMNKGVQFENVGNRLFNTTPIAIAFKRGAGATEGFVALGAADRLVRVTVDATGTPSINAPTALLPPATLSNIVRIPVGKNPQGLVINSTDTRAYVMNFISRDVSVVDLSAATPAETARIASSALPLPGTLAAKILRGNELFNTGIGPAGTIDSSLPPAGRMSNFGFGSCYSCHPNGLHDGVTWMFDDGPRRTISLHSTAEHPQPAGSMLNANGAPLLPSFKQRALNRSATQDEIPDQELTIRAVNGGQGLITDGMGVFNLLPTANTGRSADLDAIAAYVSMGIRAPISPLRPRNVGGGQVDPEIAQGRALFAAANCQQCHGGPNWTRSRIDFTPPPLGETIVGGQLTKYLVPVGTFDASAFNEVRGVGTTIVGANGALGFNTPSLLSVYAGAPYFHSGAALTLDEVLQNVTHRAAGTSGVDTLTSAADRAKLVKFLKSIDAVTLTFP